MLILSRKRLESVLVGAEAGLAGSVRVTVLGIRQGRVRLGFEGDAGIPVHREELWKQIHSSHPQVFQAEGRHRTDVSHQDGVASVLSGG